MKHISALIIKYLMTSVMIYLVFGLFARTPFRYILMPSLILTVGAYLIGDLFILPIAGNIIATISDFGIAFLGLYLFARAGYLPVVASSITSVVLTAALAIAVGEYIFHGYVREHVLGQTNV